MNDKKIDNPVFSYVKERSARNYSLVRSSVAFGICTGISMGLLHFLINFFFSDVVNIFKSVVIGIADGSFFGLAMYLCVRLAGKVMKNRQGNFITAMPTKFGKVLASIPTPNYHKQQDKFAIGGQLYICESGLCLYPNKFNWPLKPNALEVSWSNVQCIYKSVGKRGISNFLYIGNLDRLVFEINNIDHFFVVDNVDKLIEDINVVYQKNKKINI